jgi:hypothetical protein
MTPVTLSPSRSNSPRRAADRSWKGRAILSVIAIVGTLASGYASALVAVGDRDRAQIERLAKIEERQENTFKMILARLDQIDARQEQYRQDNRSDLNGVRAEILRMLMRTER